MRIAILISLLIACTPFTHPATNSHNRVCAMVELGASKAACTDLGTNAQHGDVAKIENDGGTKVCWEAFNDHGFDCATFSLSKSEVAQAATANERARAKQEAEAKAAAGKAVSTEPAVPTVEPVAKPEPDPKSEKPKIEKPKAAGK